MMGTAVAVIAFGILAASAGCSPGPGFEFPPELEGRRLSNPSGHTYDHALEVRTPAVISPVVPVLRSRVPLAELIALPPEGPAFIPNVEMLLVVVDTNTGQVARSGRGEPVIYTLEDTDWPQRMHRNTAFAVHPDEVMADNFASLMEWRSVGLPPTDTPGGVSINDVELLRSIEDVVTEGCGPVGGNSAR